MEFLWSSDELQKLIEISLLIFQNYRSQLNKSCEWNIPRLCCWLWPGMYKDGQEAGWRLYTVYHDHGRCPSYRSSHRSLSPDTRSQMTHRRILGPLQKHARIQMDTLDTLQSTGQRNFPPNFPETFQQPNHTAITSVGLSNKKFYSSKSRVHKHLNDADVESI